jgi:DNA helicase-2/ATP-dependent DNA helicase PcrA
MQLNEKQEEAANHTTGPCLVVAVPGSGKTRVLVERTVRLINSGIEPKNIISLTFTNKAAREMKQRISTSLNSNHSNMFVGTFHALCAKVLRQFGHYADLPRNFTILDSGEQKDLINKIIRQKYEKFKKEMDSDAIANVINTAREDLIDLSQEGSWNNFFSEICSDLSMVDKFVDVSKTYIEYLKKFKCVDFSGLLYESIILMQNNDLPRNKIQNSHQYLQVDEAQDTNYAQFALIKLLSEKHKNVFVVGDPDQSIYQFRGARYENIDDFIKENKDIKIIKLTYNYRSTPQIVKVSDNLIKRNKKRIDKVFETLNKDGHPVQYNEFLDPEQEANFIVNKISNLLTSSNCSPNSFVILYRTNFMSRILEETCVRMGMAYKIVGGFSFYERSEIKDCMAMLKLFANDKDVVAFSRVANLLDGIGPKTIKIIEEEFHKGEIGFVNVCQKVYSKLSRRSQASVDLLKEAYGCQYKEASHILTHIIKSIHYEGVLENSNRKDVNDRIENVYEFINSINTEENKKLSCDEVLQKISLYTSSDDSSNKNQITLMTIHAAKGLEFPVVLVVGVEKEILPHARAMTEPDGEEEERRLFYVAMTRAEKMLFVSSCRKRKIGGFGDNYRICYPSQFLKEAGLTK